MEIVALSDIMNNDPVDYLQVNISIFWDNLSQDWKVLADCAMENVGMSGSGNLFPPINFPKTLPLGYTCKEPDALGSVSFVDSSGACWCWG